MRTKSTAATAITQSVSKYMVLQLTRLHYVFTPHQKLSFLELWENTAFLASSSKGLKQLLDFCQDLLDTHTESRLAGIYSRNHIKNLIGLLTQKLSVAPKDVVAFDRCDALVSAINHVEAAGYRLGTTSSHSTLLRYSALEGLNMQNKMLTEMLKAFLPDPKPANVSFHIEILKDHIKDFRIKQAYYGKSFEVVHCGVPIVKITCKKI